MTKILLKEVIPRYGLPSSVQIDNGLLFVAKITQKVSKTLGIKWKRQVSWRPQATGKKETNESHTEEDYSQTGSRNPFKIGQGIANTFSMYGWPQKWSQVKPL